MTPWQTIFLAVIAAIPPTVAALASLMVALRNSAKADVIHKIVNGKSETDKKQAFAEGVKAAQSGGVIVTEDDRRLHETL